MNVYGKGNVTKPVKIVSDRLVTFDIAENKKDYKTQAESVSFFAVKACGYAAVNAREFKVGDNVLIAGEMAQETWDDNKTGAKRSKVVILAFSCALIHHSKKAEGVVDAPAEEAPF
jgi:single-stranded DNA-binding protein